LLAIVDEASQIGWVAKIFVDSSEDPIRASPPVASVTRADRAHVGVASIYSVALAKIVATARDVAPATLCVRRKLV